LKIYNGIILIISPCRDCKGSGIRGVTFSIDTNKLLTEKEPANFINIDFCESCGGTGFTKGAQTNESAQNK
jgi:hypothetical protein